VKGFFNIVSATNGRSGSVARTYASALFREVLLKEPGTAGNPAAASNTPGCLHVAQTGGKGLGLRNVQAAIAFIMLFITASASVAATPPGTIITNTATASYDVGAVVGIAAVSNSASTTVVTLNTASTIDFLLYNPAPGTSFNVATGAYSATGSLAGPFTPLASPVAQTLGGAFNPINLGAPVSLYPGTTVHAGEPIFVRVKDPDQDTDPALLDTLTITITTASGDSEVIVLTETGVNTGEFIGYIQTDGATGAQNDGAINVVDSDSITANYTDPNNAIDVSANAVLVDPYGILFNSLTGAPVNGATVTLRESPGGALATVYGDDGISSYPATVVSGGTVTDSGSNVYTFPAGGYRFPLIPPGNYVLEITPPPGYSVPSVVPTAMLQTLPGAPFTIITGSRLEVFTIVAGPAVRIDVPLDATSATSLFVRKDASKEKVSKGDFLQYKVEVDNATGAILNNVVVTDRLPSGFRYEENSATYNGIAAANPAISADGRTLTFSVATLGAGAKITIGYVVHVGAGAKFGEAVNSASAASGVITSNTAKAKVKVVDDLMETKSVIVGRVIPDGCGETDPNADGAEGVRIYLEDGTYAVTDKRGMFHFEGITPGTHIVQMDTATIPETYEPVLCKANTRNSGSAISQFVDVQGGTLWRADFHIKLRAKTTGQVSLSLDSSMNERTINYSAAIDNLAVKIDGVSVTISLPEGLTYKKGSAIQNNASIADPEDFGSNTLVFRLGEIGADSKTELNFAASINDPKSTKEYGAGAMMTFNTPSAKNQRTPVVKSTAARQVQTNTTTFDAITLHPQFAPSSDELQPGDIETIKKAADTIRDKKLKRVYVIGHSDSSKVRNAKNAKFKDNQNLSLARAKAVAEVLKNTLGLTDDVFVTEGKGDAEPVATNKTADGRAKNRRVEMRIELQDVIDEKTVDTAKKSSNTVSAETVGLRPGESATMQPADGAGTEETLRPHMVPMPEGKTPELEILWPTEGHHPAAPSMGIAIKHAPAEIIKVYIGGEEIAPINFEERVVSKDSTVAISRWLGIPLAGGDNVLEAATFDKDGIETKRVKRTVHYSTDPVKAAYSKEFSSLTADGKTSPVMAIRLFDKDNHPVREGLIIEAAVEPPYSSYVSSTLADKSPLTKSPSNANSFRVGKDGIVLVPITPTTKTGEVSVRVKLAGSEETVKGWLRPEKRDWVLIGLAEGTAAHGTVSKNMTTAKDMGAEYDYYEDGRIAFFTKGTIKGEWLLTMTYDSKKDGNYDQTRLHSVIDPGTYYTVYGDASEQRYEASSARPLYIKIERDQFYALFGDFDTGLTVTELSRYSRSHNGIKSEYKGDNFNYSAFATDTSQAFVKDEIRGDGTSGLYRLTRSNVVMNSEKVAIEVRDRFRSEIVISRRELMRHADYDIDYDSSTIFFKEPVASRDADFNPVYIVADYESNDKADREYNYGGRVGANTTNEKLSGGVTHVHEGTLNAEANLYGADATIEITDNTRLKVEAATTDKEVAANDTKKGSAYLAEITHLGAKAKARTYIREIDDEFGLGHTSGSEGGMRKIGLDAEYSFNTTTSASTEMYKHSNLSTGADRYYGSVKATYREKNYSLFTGVKRAEDRFVNGPINDSTQIELGGSLGLMENRLTLKASHEQSVSGNENPDFPTRTTLGGEYRLTEYASVFAAQEFTNGKDNHAELTRAGIKATPWSGAQIGSSVEQRHNEDGTRLLSNSGLKQRYQYSKHWSFDASLDRSATIKQPGSPTTNMNAPKASYDSEDFTALSLGAAYKEETWGATSRFEFRNASSEDKIGLLLGAYGEPKEGYGVSAAMRTLRTYRTTHTHSAADNLRIGFAYRPKTTQWIVLDKLDFIHDEMGGSASTYNYDNRRVVNNLNVNYKPNDRNELSVHYGIKYVTETIDNTDYSGITELIGLEGRHDVTPKVDLGAHARILHSYRTNQQDYNTGVSVGYTLVKNAWVSIGYNFSGFKDTDFSAADFTSQGVYLKFRIKVDQESAKEAVRWLTGQ